MPADKDPHFLHMHNASGGSSSSGGLLALRRTVLRLLLAGTVLFALYITFRPSRPTPPPPPLSQVLPHPSQWQSDSPAASAADADNLANGNAPVVAADTGAELPPAAQRIPNYIHLHSPADLHFGFMEREPGNLERINQKAPREQLLQRRAGVLAIMASKASQKQVNVIVSRFPPEHFTIVLFITDNSVWTDYAWFADAVAIRAASQAKYWFAKRYLTPDIVQDYDYVWVWDSDATIDKSFDPLAFVDLLKQHNIHFAQPALSASSGKSPQLQSLLYAQETSEESVGRYTNFIHQDISGTYGYCRHAIIDAFQVTRPSPPSPIPKRESLVYEAYIRMMVDKCMEMDELLEQNLPGVSPYVQTFCKLWNTSAPSAKGLLRSPRELGRIKPLPPSRTVAGAAATDSAARQAPLIRSADDSACPHPVDFPNVENLEWWRASSSK
ncbi:hypothetical protein RI367_005634 [Sorochytrium milnesiophthora]